MTGIDPVATFLQEVQELLEQLEQTLLDLEQSPEERDLIDTAFRALHTIKGSGAMFGFDAVAAFTHRFETAFDKVRKGQVKPSQALIVVALAAKDHMRALIDSPADADLAEGAAILARLDEVVGDGTGASPPAAATPAIAATPAPVTWRIRFRLHKDSMSMGTNPLLLLDELRGLGHCTVVALTDAIPALTEMDPCACYVYWDVVLTTEKPRAAIDDVFIFVMDDMELKVSALDPETDTSRLGEILLDRGDITPATLQNVLTEQKPIGSLLVRSGEVGPEQINAALAEQKHLRKEPKPEAGGSIRVQAERLDELMDRVGELVIAQARLKQLAVAGKDSSLTTVTEEIERLAAELRDTTMGIRMVPIGSLFGRFRRLVHDVSRDLGKEVELVTSGEETELDKTVIERLNDPLVHLIRNAIDHGLETGDHRTVAGKAPQGRLRLAARHAGAQVLISISDDGRGLDRDRIRARAEENGLIQPGAKLTDAELFQLIFLPGFSTASQVTSLSGRGVGMDVVKRTIDALRGTIDITSQPGGGTEVTLKLPLTLAIIDGLLVRVGQGRYVIPLATVDECVELSAGEDARSAGRSFLNIRDDLVPFLRLRELFDTGTAADPYQKVVIVSSGELRVGLVVDQVIGDHQTVIKSLSKLHADVQTFSGATILGDGTVALILDVAHLVEFGQVHEERLKAS